MDYYDDAAAANDNDGEDDGWRLNYFIFDIYLAQGRPVTPGAGKVVVETYCSNDFE